jgi:hypothetical protein
MCVIDATRLLSLLSNPASTSTQKIYLAKMVAPNKIHNITELDLIKICFTGDGHSTYELYKSNVNFIL